jgi:hypothetical protein
LASRDNVKYFTVAVNRIMEGTIHLLKPYIRQLVPSPKFSFDFKSLPKVPGIYAIYDNDDSLIYVGKTNNLARRLLREHKSGNRRGSAFRRAMSIEKGLDEEAKLTSYILRNCKFQYLELSDERLLSAVEHFAISVLNPRLNK